MRLALFRFAVNKTPIPALYVLHHAIPPSVLSTSLLTANKLLSTKQQKDRHQWVNIVEHSACESVGEDPNRAKERELCRHYG